MAKVSEDNKELTQLTAISPLDGRYRSQTAILAPYVSEDALIRARMEVEGKYLVALSEVGLVRSLSGKERRELSNIGDNLTPQEVARVKEIEDMTNHDVKAVERAFREKVAGTSLSDITEMIHFGLTSEDVNNLAYRLMFVRAKKNVMVPALHQLIDALVKQADEHKGLAMLARTHGQPAVPTTYGKELVVFATRLAKQTKKFKDTELTGKLNGAVGNFNAHSLAVPKVDWIQFSKKFVKGLGLHPVLYTTQINPHDDMVENFQALQRVNGVILDLDQDMWRYISDNWLTQKMVKGEVGSSTMPQKVNPIDFEKSEGNIVMADGILEAMGRKLMISRLQRDLSGSTIIRNVGVALAYSYLSYASTLKGLSKVFPNPKVMGEALDANWSIVSEGAQTVLRRAGVEDPYSLTAKFVKGQKINSGSWKKWVKSLPVSDLVKGQLLDLTPEKYVGYAEKLTEMAIKEIKLT